MLVPPGPGTIVPAATADVVVPAAVGFAVPVTHPANRAVIVAAAHSTTATVTRHDPVLPVDRVMDVGQRHELTSAAMPPPPVCGAPLGYGSVPARTSKPLHCAAICAAVTPLDTGTTSTARCPLAVVT